jgi:cell division protein FtsL
MTPPAAAAAPAVRTRRSAAPAPARRAPTRPRRVSGPARPAKSERPWRRQSRRPNANARWLAGALRGISRHALLDRLLRGRLAIALVAFALIGIVTLQLGLLKLNSSIGRTLERESLLQRENAALSIEDSEIAAGDRVEAQATRLGMQLAPVAALRFLSVRPRADSGRAAGALRVPLRSSAGESPEASAGSAAAGATARAAGAPEQTPTAQAGASPEQASTPAGEATAGGAATPGGGETSPPGGGSPPATVQQSAPAAAAQAPSASSETKASPAGGTQAGPTG